MLAPAAVLSGTAAAVLWSVADMLLVGFVPSPDTVANLMRLGPPGFNAALAALMLEGSQQRLIWGITLATFSVFLYILAVYGIWRCMRPGRMARIAALALLVGYALSPVGHAGFGYVGLMAQSMPLDGAALPQAQVEVFNRFEYILNIHWLASVTMSATGWLLFLALTLTGRTTLPRFAACANPVLLAPFIGMICLQFPGSLPATLIGCASLNLAQLVCLLVLLRLGFRADDRRPEYPVSA